MSTQQTVTIYEMSEKRPEPKLCECGCGLLHTKRGKYATDVCAKRAYKAAHTSTKGAHPRKSVKVKRDWISPILACRATDGSCRLVIQRVPGEV